MPITHIAALIISVIGGISDWKTRKIPNWLTFGTFFLALIYSIFQFNLNAFLNCFVGFFVGLLILLIPYILGGMGAGDVKLLAAIGSLVGYKNIVVVFFYTAIAGLFIGIFWIISRPGHLKFLISTGQVFPTVDKKEKVPYGLAIMCGTIGYVFLKYKYFPFW
jgi:prepilin peptidase CpaA